MSGQRCAPELKNEAVRQVIDRGHGVASVAAELGVSANTLYKWVRAVKPDRSEDNSRELLEAKSEILKLKGKLRRVEEERGILRKAARYFAKELE